MVAVTDAAFIDAWHRLGSPVMVSTELGISIRRVYTRRSKLADRGIRLETRPAPGTNRVSEEWAAQDGWTFPREERLEIHDGAVVVSSDHHYWPGAPSVAHRALLAVIAITKPRLKVLNGDVLDGGKIGRHPPFGWAKRPSAKDELHAAQERVGEIEQALPRGCERRWNVGNHCIRFERSLATAVPDFEGIRGFRLSDHFPGWEMAWSTLINADSPHPVMIKHRFAGGVHAAYNNTMKGGISIVTGHTHLLEVKPWGDYRGRRWGVQTGTLADHHGPQFEYTENAPSPACSGFAVLTFVNGHLAPPELCEVIDGRAWFRGQIIA